MLYIPRSGRVCKVCNQWHPVCQMSKSKLAYLGVKELCNPCAAQISLTRKWLNIEEQRKRDRENAKRRRDQNPEKYHAQARRRYKNNTEYYAMYNRRYRIKYPHVRRTNEWKRRTRKLNLPSNFTDADWRRCLDYFDHRCAACNRPVGFWHTLAADHWIPLNSPDCPGTIPTNIIPLCHGQDGCNNHKKDCDPRTWLNRDFNPRKAKQILARIEAYFAWIKEQH